MSWFVVFLGLVLASAGGAAIVASIDLLTTELGLLYATCGAIGLSGGLIVIAIGILIGRVGALRLAVLRGIEATRPERVEPLLAGLEPVVLAEPAGGAGREPPAVEFAEPAMTPAPAPTLDDAGDHEAAINENRKGRLPSLEQATREPAEPPTLVGRYSAGGANYSIFSDGSIEAETDQGAFKFESMNEFKAFIAAKRN